MSPQIKALKSARLMLYAWKAVRQRDKLGPHPELDETIKEIEAALNMD